MKKIILTLLLVPVFSLPAAQAQTSAERTQDDLERLADSLRYVGTVPHLGMVPPDPVFWRIVDGGLEIVPHLIDRMTDTREIPELYVKYFGGVYTVADVAYVALQEIIADIPTFDLLGVPYSEMYGYNVYWWHVRESRRNRRNFRRAVRGWYEENRDNLVRVEWHLSLSGDTNFAPSKGHYVVKGNDISDLLLSAIPVMSQDRYDFKAEQRESGERVRQVDSIRYGKATCEAVYPAFAIFKSHMSGRHALLEYCRQHNREIYSLIEPVDSSCELYQSDPDNRLVFDLCRDAVDETFDFERDQNVRCELLILTLYEGAKQETIRLITSMKREIGTNK